eukprot:TRINITY_DN61248_c0_g1_i1.p1 TRINITY_DN61248_c0_g1~~TRINITY_DN61248_c0_g1_i1.p1  ORF type:complete len:871 (+),score=212.53 TRINITY_DN61248_c0_g1_i1:79-2613(+)
MPIDGIEKEKNPLAFVDRLLPEERDSNLHFGDVRFWKHIEFIDVSQIFRTSSLEYRTMKLMFFEATFYVIFLIALTAYINVARPPNVYEARRQQLDYWGGCQRGASGADAAGDCRFHAVSDRDSLFDWLENDFIPKAFTMQDMYHTIADASSIFRLQLGIAPWAPRYVGDTMNTVLLGTVRIRQLRVQYNKACVIRKDFQAVHSDCFAPFLESVESKMSWAPEWTPEHLKGLFEWSPANKTDMMPMVGQHGVYPGGGFYFDLPRNDSSVDGGGASTRMKELRAWEWLDMRSRAVIIEMSTLMPNVNIIVHNRMLAEFPAVGGVITRHEAFAAQILQLSMSLRASEMVNGDAFGPLGLLILSVALHGLLFFYVVFLIYQNGLRFFLYFWSCVDVAILVIFFLCVSINLSVGSTASTLPNMAPETIGDPEIFFPLGRLVPTIELADGFLAMLGVLGWVKILKYFTLVSSIHGFVRVIERCLLNLAVFGGLLVIVLFGFACAFFIGYGGEDDIFSTLFGSFVACVVAPAGGVSFHPIFKNEDIMGPALIAAYFVAIFLLLLNTFMAICVDTYTVTMYELNEVTRITKHSPMKIFFWTYYFSVVEGVRLVGQETEEDKGAADEQSIPLTSLPEAIGSRFMATKRRMEAVKDAAENKIESERLELLQKKGLLEDDAEGGSRSQSKKYQPMIEDVPAPKIPVKTNAEAFQEEVGHIMVKRVQLQRMLDDDEVLQEICGTKRAIDLMRRFRVSVSGVDPYEAVAKLQANVAKKLREIGNSKLTFDEIETLRTVSSEMHGALTESQKDWRNELLSVLQMATLLSKALIKLTQMMETVQHNHNDLAERCGPPK